MQDEILFFMKAIREDDKISLPSKLAILTVCRHVYAYVHDLQPLGKLPKKSVCISDSSSNWEEALYHAVEETLMDYAESGRFFTRISCSLASVQQKHTAGSPSCTAVLKTGYTTKITVTDQRCLGKTALILDRFAAQEGFPISVLSNINSANNLRIYWLYESIKEPECIDVFSFADAVKSGVPINDLLI